MNPLVRKNRRCDEVMLNNYKTLMQIHYNFSNLTKLILITLVFSFEIYSQSSSISDAKILFKEWIATEKLQSKESSDWEIEKESISDLSTLLQEELATLKANLEELEKENNAGEEERIKLNDENEALKNAILPLSDSLKKIESNILRISKSFPDPLNDDLSSFLARISKANKEENTSSISQRLQAVVGALVKIDKFNSTIAFDEKLLPTVEGEKKVLVLYFGLGIAYYTDEKGNKAGYLLPGSKGWTEHEKPGYGPAILEAISFYKKTAQKQATFVELPFRTN